MSARRFTDGGQAAVVLALVVALILAPGCIPLKKIVPGTGAPPPWCGQVQSTYAFAVEKVYPFLDVAAQTGAPEIAERWPELKTRIEAGMTELNNTCAEPAVTDGLLGGPVAFVANLLSEALSIYGAFAGHREMRSGGDDWIEHRARMDALQARVSSRTGARSSASRSIGRRSWQAPPDDPREIRSPGRRPTP